MQSSDIVLGGFSQILIWPLVIRLSAQGLERRSGMDEKIRRQMCLLADRLKSDARWAETPDLLDHLPEQDQEQDSRRFAYGEFVYFHDYLQSVLFRGPPKAPCNAEIRLFRRVDITSAEVEIKDETSGRFRVRPSVRRCNLYLLATGAAILVLELRYGASVSRLDAEGQACGDAPLSFAHALTLNDHLRRVYAPYFRGAADPAKIPRRLVFRDKADRTIAEQDSVRNSALDEFLNEADGGFLREADISGRRTPPVLPAWRGLVAPLECAGYTTLGAEHCWRHVVDERIPLMSHVSLTREDTRRAAWTPAEHALQRRDFAAVGQGDMVRLCFADEAGGDLMPYNPGFLADFAKNYCYDRFLPHGSTTSAVRYMFAGYHTCAVGAGVFFDEVVIEHFRRHYFQMALLTQIEFATLLAVSSRISDAVARYRERRGLGVQAAVAKARSDFQREILETQRDFLEFAHLYRFSAVSNEIQAGEMFTLWRRTMGLQTLYDDVRSELDAATTYVLGIENKEQAEAANWLGAIAAIGLALSLIFAALGINVFLDGKSIEMMTHGLGCEKEGCTPLEPGFSLFLRPHYGMHLAILGAVMMVIGLGGWWLVRRRASRSADPAIAQGKRVLGALALTGGATAAVGLLLWATKSLAFSLIVPAMAGLVGWCERGALRGACTRIGKGWAAVRRMMFTP